jgi:hypothetical protein
MKKKWEGSKADKSMDRRQGYSEGSKKDDAIDRVQQKKLDTGKKATSKVPKGYGKHIGGVVK